MRLISEDRPDRLWDTESYVPFTTMYPILMALLCPAPEKPLGTWTMMPKLAPLVVTWQKGRTSTKAESQSAFHTTTASLPLSKPRPSMELSSEGCRKLSLAAHCPAAASWTVTILLPVCTQEESSFRDTESYGATA